MKLKQRSVIYLVKVKKMATTKISSSDLHRRVPYLLVMDNIRVINFSPTGTYWVSKEALFYVEFKNKKCTS